MPVRNPILSIPEPATRITATPTDDATETTLVAVQLPGPPAYMQVYAVTRAGVATPIGRDDALGKADSGAAIRFRDGTVRVFVSEADPVAGSPGSTSGVTYYDYPGVFPPLASTGTVDQALLNRITALENKLAQALQELNLMRGTLISVDSRLDSISIAARG